MTILDSRVRIYNITCLLQIFGIKLCAEASSFESIQVAVLFSAKIKKINSDTTQNYLKGGKKI